MHEIGQHLTLRPISFAHELSRNRIDQRFQWKGNTY